MLSPDEEALGIDLDEPEVERGPLSTGINPWQRVVYDPKLRYRMELEQRGVMVTCEGCGKQWKVHPMFADRVKACGVNCRTRVWHERRKGRRPERPKWSNPWLNGDKAS